MCEIEKIDTMALGICSKYKIMELHQLRYFCTVARAGSFTRAAEELGIGQPSL
jgi:hypothetical protein